MITPDAIPSPLTPLRTTLGPAHEPLHTLACLAYSASNDDNALNIPLAAFGPAPECEVWQASPPLQSGSYRGINYSASNAVCFGSLHVTEHDQDIAMAAERAYLNLHALGEYLGFPHMLRVWHYLHDLNEGEGDAERYKQFCLGRAKALEAAKISAEHLPAATLVSSLIPGVRMHFMLVEQPPLNLENPRQTSAYDYPREYGPRQPAFARASVMNWPNTPAQLFISGTASIVGHRSEHPGDLSAQLDESLRNVSTLLALKTVRERLGPLQLADLDFLKVYLRHAEHVDEARQHLRTQLGPNLPLIFLHAELCRSELLVEVETQVTG